MGDTPKIVVLGIGNILMSDEGVGVRAVERLLNRYRFPENVDVYDGGTTGMHGLLPLIEEADRLIVIDAVNGTGVPGTVYRYTLEDFKLSIPKKLSAHDVGFIECLAVAELNDRLPGEVIVIGIKPQDVATYSMKLTDTINAKLDHLGALTLDELRRFGAEPTSK